MKKITALGLLTLIIMLASFSVVAASNSKTVFSSLLEDETGTGSTAHGNAVLILADDGSQLKFKLVVNGLENTIMAHIHVSELPGGNGPPVLWLYPGSPPSMLIEGTFNGLLSDGVVTSADLVGPLAGASLDDLRTAIEEGRAYVNVHTSAFPGGEIRGQIE